MNHTDTINSPRAIPEYIEPEWVETPTSTLIRTTLIHAQKSPTIALIHGGAGIGKTLTAERYLAEHPKKLDSPYRSDKPAVYMMRACNARKTVTSCLKAIAEQIGHYEDAFRNDTYLRLIERALNPGDLLIVDEAQHLSIEALDQIRYFHDAVGIGIAYLGNDVIHTSINGRGKQAKNMGPLSRRIGMRLPLQSSTKDDVITILSAWNIYGLKECEFACDVGMGRGGIGSLAQVLRHAALISKHANLHIDVRVMRKAASNLGFY